MKIQIHPLVLVIIVLLIKERSVLAEGGGVIVTLSANDSSVYYQKRISSPNSSTEIINADFSFQPGKQYRLQVSSSFSTQPLNPGSNGYRSSMTISLNGANALQCIYSQHDLSIQAMWVSGQPNEAYTITSNTLPFSRTFTASKTGINSHSSASGDASSQLNGGGYLIDTKLVADATLRVPDSNMAHAYFRSDAYFTVSQPTSVSLGGTISFEQRGSSQQFPILPVVTTGPPTAPTFVFIKGPQQQTYDPPLAQGYTFTMTGTARFTEIMEFPIGIPASYYVITEGQTYGPYTPQQSVNLLALRGHGVAEFVVKGIKPFVAADSPVAFPIKLDFTEPTADFNMTPIAAPDVEMVTLPNGDAQFTFVGVLQHSTDLVNWTDITPAPTSPHVIPKVELAGRKFFRSRDP